MLQRDVVDQLHDEHGLADARTPEEAGLAAFRVRLKQVDDLDPGLEHLDFGRLLLERRGLAVDRQPVVGLDRTALVHRVADDVDHPAERMATDRNRDRLAEVDSGHPTYHAVRRLHGDAPRTALTEVLRDFGDDVDRYFPLVVVIEDPHRVVDGRQVSFRELHVDHRTDDLDHATFYLLVHSRSTPYSSSAWAPETISMSSLVMAAWRVRLYTSVRCLIMSWAFFVAASIAVIRAACSAAAES